MDSGLILILCIVFVAILIRSTFGFGDALIAMPLLAMILELKIATPLMALIAFFTALAILAKNVKNVEFKSVWRLILSSIIGIPIGLWYLNDINENLIKFILGIIVMFFAIYNLVKPVIMPLKREWHAWIFGLVAGVLGGAYNTNGPPIIIYSSLKKWDPVNFRATLQGYFFSTGIFIIISHALAGNFSKPVLTYFLYCLPVVIVAIIIGKQLNNKIPVHKFHKYIYIMLFVIGIMLIINSTKNLF